MKNIILIGAGGHCKSCIDVIEQTNQYEIKGILDPNKIEPLLGYPIINKPDEYIEQLVKKDYYFLITIGQIKTAKTRVRIYELLKKYNAKIATIISPLAYVSKHATIKEGTIIMHYALVNADATIEENCIINSKALIEHDALIGKHTHISTGAIINGGVEVLKESFFGSGAISKEYIKVDGFIKAGSLIK
jgi:sugar O-acyltransferase (sialic acid O-acetyltransferase NeuD family)